MNEPEIVWALVKDNFEHARAHETYRSNVTALIVTLSGALLGSLAFFAENGNDAKYVFLALGLIGTYGALVNAKHYERFRMHVHIATNYISLLKDSGTLTTDLNCKFSELQRDRKWKHSYLAKIDLNWLWSGFPALIGIAGFLRYLC
ncbi:MAG: hypothetical protein HWE26_18615 [Alteromonadaceae bacterium]|nr:hypothetical protein [Alteromonadaceae bacterium]